MSGLRVAAAVIAAAIGTAAPAVPRMSRLAAVLGVVRRLRLRSSKTHSLDGRRAVRRIREQRAVAQRSAGGLSSNAMVITGPSRAL